MITCMLDNYLSHDECDRIIEYHKKNKSKTNQYHNILPIKLGPDTFPFLSERLSRTSKFLGNNQVDWAEVVRWPVDSFQDYHLDKTETHTTAASIIYLNDNYEGGETNYEEGTIFKPKKGRLLFFNGMYYRHGVNKVLKTDRYTVATWYKKIK